MEMNSMSLEFPSKAKNVSFARAAVAAFVSQLDPTMPELADIRTAVSEAVTNSIVHAYPPGTEGRIKITVHLTDRQVSIEIKDYGDGISNPDAVRRLGMTTCDPDRMGIGLSLIEACMDDMKLESSAGEGTRVFMVKRFGQQGGVGSNG